MGQMATVVGKYLDLEVSGAISKALCPFHNDNATKSLTVYKDSAYCFGCGRYFTPITFLVAYLHITKEEAAKRLGLIADLPPVPSFSNATSQTILPISAEVIRNWHAMLKPRHREYFSSRGFADLTIDRELWGWDGHRYVVTVWDGKPGLRCVCVRRRAAGGAEPKYIGYKDHNPRVLYNLWNATHPDPPQELYMFFGEFDAALAYQDGFPAISPTNGQNAWMDVWDETLRPYRIIIIPDRGEELRGFQVASRFPCNSQVVCWPKGNFNDYNSFRLAGGTPAAFRDIVLQCEAALIKVECHYALAGI